jgi:hypothetical protein
VDRIFFQYKCRYYKSDTDPTKPKNFLEKTMAKVNATVEAEAAAIAGCNVEIFVSFLLYVLSLAYFTKKRRYSARYITIIMDISSNNCLLSFSTLQRTSWV